MKLSDLIGSQVVSISYIEGPVSILEEGNLRVVLKKRWSPEEQEEITIVISGTGGEDIFGVICEVEIKGVKKQIYGGSHDD